MTGERTMTGNLSTSLAFGLVLSECVARGLEEAPSSTLEPVPDDQAFLSVSRTLGEPELTKRNESFAMVSKSARALSSEAPENFISPSTAVSSANLGSSACSHSWSLSSRPT